MTTSRGHLRIALAVLLFGLGGLAGWSATYAHTKPRSPAVKPAASAPAGRYCGGDPHETRGASLNLGSECRLLYGANASPIAVRPDAYGLVCRIAGKPDGTLQLQAACRRAYGDTALATLVGIGPNDWRCLRPEDVNGRVVPVLLVPGEKVTASEVPFVAAARGRVETLMDGVRRFYADRTSNAVSLSVTNAFVLPTRTPAADWQQLALATDHAVPGFPLQRFGFHDRVKQAFVDGGWDGLAKKAKVKLGGFVTIGSASAGAASWLGAASDMGQTYFSQAPLTSYVACDQKKANAADYERAFYGAAHELGHTFGLDDTNNFPFGGSVRRPSNWTQSVMYQGNGTQSELFDFEQQQMLQFLRTWR